MILAIAYTSDFTIIKTCAYLMNKEKTQGNLTDAEKDLLYTRSVDSNPLAGYMTCVCCGSEMTTKPLVDAVHDILKEMYPDVQDDSAFETMFESLMAEAYAWLHAPINNTVTGILHTADGDAAKSYSIDFDKNEWIPFFRMHYSYWIHANADSNRLLFLIQYELCRNVLHEDFCKLFGANMEKMPHEILNPIMEFAVSLQKELYKPTTIEG